MRCYGEAVAMLEKCLETYKRCGQTEKTDPDTIWKVYDYLAQAHSGNNDREMEIKRYEVAIRILRGMEGPHPEVRESIHYSSSCHWLHCCTNRFVIILLLSLAWLSISSPCNCSISQPSRKSSRKYFFANSSRFLEKY